jgi:hypothetical protein
VAPTNLAPVHPYAFSQLLSGVVGAEIARVDRILAKSQLQCCEFEDEFGCGAIATVGSLEYEREYCDRHFRQLNLWRAMEAVSR